MCRSPLQRSTRRMKRSPLRTRRKQARSAVEQLAADVWNERGPCEVAAPHICDGRVENHHVIDREKLNQIGRPDLVYDVRNRFRIDHRTHRRHTTAVERIPFEWLPAAAIEFAREIGLVWWLERFYPSSRAAA